jgi:hypothetical protein
VEGRGVGGELWEYFKCFVFVSNFKRREEGRREAKSH